MFTTDRRLIAVESGQTSLFYNCHKDLANKKDLWVVSRVTALFPFDRENVGVVLDCHTDAEIHQSGCRHPSGFYKKKFQLDA